MLKYFQDNNCMTKNLCVAISGISEQNGVFLKSVYKTEGQRDDVYYCKNGGDIYYCYVYVASGRISLNILKDLKITVSSGSGIILLSNEVKKYKCLDDGTIYYWAFFLYNGNRLPINIPFKIDNCETIEKDFDSIQYLLNQQETYSLLNANAMFSIHFIDGVKKVLKDVVYSQVTNIAILNSVDYINENLFKLPIVEDIAKMYGMSTKKFCKEFEKVMGQTPSKYIKDKKLSIAKNYLDGTDLTLVEISRLLDFSSPFYLSKCFKEAFGLTPKDYKISKMNK